MQKSSDATCATAAAVSRLKRSRRWRGCFHGAPVAPGRVVALVPVGESSRVPWRTTTSPRAIVTSPNRLQWTRSARRRERSSRTLVAGRAEGHNLDRVPIRHLGGPGSGAGQAASRRVAGGLADLRPGLLSGVSGGGVSVVCDVAAGDWQLVHAASGREAVGAGAAREVDWSAVVDAAGIDAAGIWMIMARLARRAP